MYSENFGNIILNLCIVTCENDIALLMWKSATKEIKNVWKKTILQENKILFRHINLNLRNSFEEGFYLHGRLSKYLKFIITANALL